MSKLRLLLSGKSVPSAAPSRLDLLPPLWRARHDEMMAFKAANEWPGPPFGASYTNVNVTGIAQLRNVISNMTPNGSTHYRIGMEEGGVWDTGTVEHVDLALKHQFGELGGSLTIERNSGHNPQINCLFDFTLGGRHILFNDLELTSRGGATYPDAIFAVKDANYSGDRLSMPVIRVTNCRIGGLYRAAESETQFGLWARVMGMERGEQVVFEGNTFKGVRVGLVARSVRYLRSQSNDFQKHYDDAHQLAAESNPLHQYSPGTFADEYRWFIGGKNTFRNPFDREDLMAPRQDHAHRNGYQWYQGFNTYGHGMKSWIEEDVGNDNCTIEQDHGSPTPDPQDAEGVRTMTTEWAFQDGSFDNVPGWVALVCNMYFGCNIYGMSVRQEALDFRNIFGLPTDFPTSAAFGYPYNLFYGQSPEVCDIVGSIMMQVPALGASRTGTINNGARVVDPAAAAPIGSRLQDIVTGPFNTSPNRPTLQVWDATGKNGSGSPEAFKTAVRAVWTSLYSNYGYVP